MNATPGNKMLGAPFAFAVNGILKFSQRVAVFNGVPLDDAPSLHVLYSGTLCPNSP